MTIKHRLFIDNDWIEAAMGRVFPTIDPATEEVIAEIARAGADDVDRAVQAADKAMKGAWRSLSPMEDRKSVV